MQGSGKKELPLASIARLDMNAYFDNWTIQVRKGLLDLCVLSVLVERERYGYELVKALVSNSNLCITEGTIYPLLSRLRLQGLITARLEESPEGPARKYYSLTKDGRKVLSAMNDYLDTLQQSTRQLQKGA